MTVIKGTMLKPHSRLIWLKEGRICRQRYNCQILTRNSIWTTAIKKCWGRRGTKRKGLCTEGIGVRYLTRDNYLQQQFPSMTMICLNFAYLRAQESKVPISQSSSKRAQCWKMRTHKHLLNKLILIIRCMMGHRLQSKCLSWTYLHWNKVRLNQTNNQVQILTVVVVVFLQGSLWRRVQAKTPYPLSK